MEIKVIEGNIPIDKDKLNKYRTVREIFDNERDNYNDGVVIKNNIDEINNIDINNLISKEVKMLAKKIFKKYNNGNVFINNGNEIVVTGRGVEESINKIFNSKTQRTLLKEHLLVFSDLGDIIEHATLVNQSNETKNRVGIKLWSYYFDSLNIDGITYNLEFDVRTMDNGYNQYRVQRIEIKK